MFQKPNRSGIQVGAKEMALKLRWRRSRQMPQRAANHATGHAKGLQRERSGITRRMGDNSRGQDWKEV